MFEVNISRKDLDILNKLCFKVAADIHDDKVNAAGQVSPYKLLRKKFAKALRSACYHHVRALFWGEPLLD